MRRLNDLYGVSPPHIAERMAVVAFDRLPALKARAEALVETNRATYREILGGHAKLEQTIFEAGTTVFPRLADGDGDAFFQRLVSAFDTSVVPGRFFEAPAHIRIGLGGDVAMTREGLARIAEALG
jgi:aspartate/methionine/tyrosine aminotransferase